MFRTKRFTSAKVAVRFASLSVGLLILSACATPALPPTSALQAAQTAITNAERAQVADYASPELGVARQKLKDANAAVAQEDMLRAERLAEQSQAEAELALVKSQVVNAKRVNDEMLRSNTSLKQEMQRNTGGQQ